MRLSGTPGLRLGRLLMMKRTDMKNFAYAAVLGMLLVRGASAAPLYAVNFTGTVTHGTASDYNPALSNTSMTQFADLAGAHVSGSLLFDLGAAPAPTVTTGFDNFINTTIHSAAALPVFVSESFTIDGLKVPAGYYPMPTTFNQPAIPTVPGSIVTTTSSNQLLQFSTQNPPAAQSVSGEVNYVTAWTGAFVGGAQTDLAVLIQGITPFFAVPPTGSLPATFGPATLQNGVFSFAVLSADPKVTTNFGITAWWDVNGNFTIDSASGGLVLPTPEPGTVLLGTAGALILLVIKFVGKRQ